MTREDYGKANPIVETLRLDSVDSTMLEAERQAASGRSGPLVICARQQSGGAGRHGRPWASPPGNLYWTILLTDAADRPRDAGLAFAAGLAVLDTLEGAGVPPDRLTLKWPNDILLDSRKIAGVLVRGSMTGSHAQIVVGIGINVASAPAATATPATSLDALAGPWPPVAALADALTAAFLSRRAAWHGRGLPPLRDAVSARLHGHGTPVRVALDRDRTVVLEGINEGLDGTGALRVRTPDGVRHTVFAGDVLA